MAIARISIDEVEEKIIINFDIAEKEKKSTGANRVGCREAFAPRRTSHTTQRTDHVLGGSSNSRK